MAPETNPTRRPSPLSGSSGGGTRTRNIAVNSRALCQIELPRNGSATIIVRRPSPLCPCGSGCNHRGPMDIPADAWSCGCSGPPPRDTACGTKRADTRELRPKSVCLFDIETFVQVQSNPQSRLIDGEESSKPRAEEENHPRICVSESDLSVGLSTLRCIKSQTRHQEFLVRDVIQSLVGVRTQALDLSQLCET